MTFLSSPGRAFLLPGLALLWAAGSAHAAPSPAEEVEALAAQVVALSLEADPTIAYFTGLTPPTHGRFADHSPKALRALERQEDALLTRLNAIDAKALPGPSLTTHAILREMLEAGRGLRICHSEQWSLSHMFGWQLQFPEIAEKQPIETADLRAQALQRWRSVPRYVDTEIAQLRTGLSRGYSVPKSVVRRVIQQLDGLLAAQAEASAFYSPAKRSEDPAFQKAFASVITTQIHPALKKYRQFLDKTYLPKARDSLGLSALPNGKACYAAYLRFYTTLDRSPQEVFDLGRQTVEKNVAEVQSLGQKTFGTSGFAEIISRLKTDPANRFTSEDEVFTYSRALVERAREASANSFLKMPSQPIEVRPYPDYMKGSGVSSHYEFEPDPKKPARYMLQLDDWKELLRSDAAVTALHEAWPGHHMQIATASAAAQTDIARLAFNSAYAEGWARYAEALSEELGLYDSDAAKMARRAWPARGMVADPGLHLYGWTREQVTAYAKETGRFNQAVAEELADRIAVMPGQLTAYDSGGLEFRALRTQAEAALGPRFDLRQFHQVVLENGTIPLLQLRANVEAWIQSQQPH
ncbi:conserved uncharacterized protein [Stigmatella aurantiaca DW4/3-1]|uniref:Conserved uncharacterized protein n=1 Tax=Stigmatella aurantiaca (strain DW4/3-1) TaxID=378806 RepID=Q093G0_STIAD|nr:conserved uncharacterized protein [Stigmatella aurantiaca DW4/3-1]EAU66867.1 conserved hypothetical protein [Stigmatella aurantiaca DW4/3-1]